MKVGVRAKQIDLGGGGGGGGEEETLACKPHDSGKCHLIFHSSVHS